MTDAPQLAREMRPEQLCRAARHAIENAEDMDTPVREALFEVKTAILHLKVMRDRLAKWDAEHQASLAAQQQPEGQ